MLPLPAWEAMTAKEHKEAVRELVTEIEERSREALEAKGSRPLGERAIRAQNPHDRPRCSKRSPAPVAHAATVETWLAPEDVPPARLPAHPT